MTCVCHSSESSSQFHVEIWCYHHVDLYKYIYYCYAKQLDVLWQMFYVKYSSDYAYNSVHLWFLQFPKNILLPYNMYVFFNFTLYVFYNFWHILISYWVHFFHIIFYFMLYACIFCTNQLQYIMLVHIQWCTVYVIYIRYIYIWDIYISINFTVPHTSQVAPIVIPKTILKCTTDICHEISQYDICSVRLCLFLAICIVSHNQFSGVQHHLFHYEICT